MALLSDLPVSFLGRKQAARNASSPGGWASPLSDGPPRPADDFNRVILPMKRGQEYTDYINASFIDVSARLSRARARVPPPGVGPHSGRGARLTRVHGGEGRTCLRTPNRFISRISCFKRRDDKLSVTPCFFIPILVYSDFPDTSRS